MKMRAVCLQHVPFEGPGAFAHLLETRGYRVEQRLVPTDGLTKDAGDFLLVMGGSMSVNDPDAWIKEEIAFIKQAVQAGTPVLGICLGAQLLAKALGASVRPGRGLEIGMTKLRVTAEGKSDPWIGSLPNPFEVFEWHGEVFELPAGAVPLASSELCPLQAFRYGSKAYGLLFHLEIERPGIEALCRECPDDLLHAKKEASALIRDSEPHLPQMQAWADRLIAHLTASSASRR
ncbi:MAG: type 1 glutamine amidotransferase [Nitrospirota bacterium]